jgi:dTDP-4-dehydrorhamnose reductase
MRIVITGATGVLGSSIANLLKIKKYKLFQFGFKKKSEYNLDLTNNKKLLLILKKIKPDAIINCAAFTNVNYCEENFIYGYRNNVVIVDSLISALLCLRKKPHLIHISTDQVYNGGFGIKNTENIVKLTNNYSVLKYISELAIKKYKKNTILRTNFFGKSYSSDKKTFSGYIASLLKKNKHVKLASNIFFNPINLKILSEVIEQFLKKRKYGIFNVGSKSSISKFEFGKIVANKLNLNSQLIKKYNSNYSIDKRPFNTVVSVTKVEKYLNCNLGGIEDNFIGQEII